MCMTSGIAHFRAVHHGLVFLFMISGTAALIYQICWQRLLFEGFGVDIESVTIVVSTFMLGLGLGALAGGEIADRFPDRVIPMFAMIELATGAFGVCSPYLIRAISAATVNGSLATIAAVNFGLLTDTDDVDGRYSANSCNSCRPSLSKPRCVGRRSVFRQHLGSRIWSGIHRLRSPLPFRAYLDDIHRGGAQCGRWRDRMVRAAAARCLALHGGWRFSSAF